MVKSLGSVIILLLLALVGYQFFQQQQLQQEVVALQSEVGELRQLNVDAEARLLAAEERLERAEKASIRGVIDQTNKALVDGLGTFLEGVSREIDQARKNLDESTEEAPQNGVE